MDEFTMQLAVCAASAASLALLGTASPLFALALFALSQAGYFALLQLQKGGVKQPWPAALLVAATFACFFASALLFNAINALSALAYVPMMFILPSIVVAARELFA
jgi:hypothetical protein